MTPTLLSLFDYSGAWSQPFAAAGWEVIQVDLKHGHDIAAFTARGLFEDLQGYPSIDGVIAAPPCTDFTNAGAQYWAAKDRDGRTARAVHLVYQVLRTVDLFRPAFWALENPIGRLPELCPELGRAAKDVWEPWEFARWTEPSPEVIARLDALRAQDGRGLSRADQDLVRDVGAYTKKTVLWGDFARPDRRPIEPVKCVRAGSWLMALGGKSEQTKTLRSLTPAGFARAFCTAQLRHFRPEYADNFAGNAGESRGGSEGD